MQDREGNTPLHSAVGSLMEKEKAPICALLIEFKATVCARDKNGRTVLHGACAAPNPDCMNLLMKMAYREDRGAVNMLDNCGRSCLHDAAEVANIEATEKFIEKGAEVSLADEFGLTPLHLAAQHGYSILAKILLNSKAKVDAKDGHGMTPLLAASGEVMLES